MIYWSLGDEFQTYIAAETVCCPGAAKQIHMLITTQQEAPASIVRHAKQCVDHAD